MSASVDRTSAAVEAERPGVRLSLTGEDQVVRVLVVEDEPEDAELIQHALAADAIAFATVVTDHRAEFVDQLELQPPDVVLADYSLPGFSGEEALELVQARCPGVPVIVVSGVLDDERAVEVLKKGAADYVLKDRMARLGPAVRRALAEAAEAAEQVRLAEELSRAHRQTAESLILLETLQSNAPVGFGFVDLDFRFIRLNTTLAEINGLPPEDHVGRTVAEIVPTVWRQIEPLYRRVLATGEPIVNVEMAGQTVGDPEGVHHWLTSFYPVRIDGELIGIGVVVVDDTDREEDKLALQRANRVLRTLSAGNQALVRATDERGLLDEMCRAIVQEGGYAFAWVAAKDPANGPEMAPLSQFGHDRAVFEVVHAAERGPASEAIQSRRVQVIGDVALLDSSDPLRGPLLDRDCRAIIALPLLHRSDCLGALVIDAAEPDAFDAEALDHLTELAANLSFGLVGLRTRAERTEYLERLDRGLEHTVEAVGSTVEVRDPYTAGHQRRVAKLAEAIARQLGLSQDERRAVRVAASIHDIGKMAVPAEILTRPGRLSPAEFELIKVHPQVGYDIIRAVEFPWPVAEMILDHHERLDGSGYPRGLAAEEIGPGTRILIVADVVEAMTHFRPYRPGLGIDVALEEIRSNADRLYDRRVVEACVAVFDSGAVDFDE